MARNLSRRTAAQFRGRRNIRYRLGGKEYLSLAAPDPPKPKGMHWRTYETQLKRCEAYERRWNSHLFSFVQRLKK
jgi:hypothetical protein